jgi:hypothetical protein
MDESARIHKPRKGIRTSTIESFKLHACIALCSLIPYVSFSQSRPYSISSGLIMMRFFSSRLFFSIKSCMGLHVSMVTQPLTLNINSCVAGGTFEYKATRSISRPVIYFEEFLWDYEISLCNLFFYLSSYYPVCGFHSISFYFSAFLGPA